MHSIYIGFIEKEIKFNSQGTVFFTLVAITY